MKKHLLFICSGGLDRSPTAASLFKDSEKFDAISCGLYPLLADNKLTKESLKWADHIFTMELQHKRDILERFPLIVKDKPEIIVLNVSNEYTRNNPDLKNILRGKLVDWL